MLGIDLDIVVQIETLDMGAQFSPDWGLDSHVGDRALDVNSDLFSLFSLHFLNLSVELLALIEEVLGAGQTNRWGLHSVTFDKVYDIMRLDYSD